VSFENRIYFAHESEGIAIYDMCSNGSLHLIEFDKSICPLKFKINTILFYLDCDEGVKSLTNHSTIFFDL
jgi:hypothetical protein